MALDYNKLMEELGNCLGLEGSATESYTKGPSKKAFEEYDEVEQELAESLGQPIPETVSDQDLVFEEGSETNPDPETDDGDESVPDNEEQPEEELFKESVKSYLTKLLEDKSPEEAKEFIGGLFGEALSEVCPDDDCGGGENPDNTDSGDEVVPDGENDNSEDNSDEESEEHGDADEGCNDDDPEAAFESLQAKMLDRYKTLSRKRNKKNSAMEGTGTKSKPVLDETAIARTSAEFGYSGQNLRKMVAEAIEKGVI